MPLHILPSEIPRRSFISTLLAASSGAAAVLAGSFSDLLQAETVEGEESETWALLSDTHVAADETVYARGINMADHLRQAVDEVLHAHSRKKFAGLMVNGDCALLDGQAGDYRTLGALLEPVVGKGIPIHLTLGNHDDRSKIQSGLASAFAPTRGGARETGGRQRPELAGKLASRIRGRFCDWYLLDSLDQTNVTPGRIGLEQLVWLEQSLKSSPDRPALVMVHHNPQPGGSGKVFGIVDTDAFLSLLIERKQVKALFFGHTHVAKTVEIEGLHLVNLPACAYSFNADQPTGWTSATVGPQGCSLKLSDIKKTHVQHGLEARLVWRSL
jgi:3',5'-cyclic-AMP phosphodiesterase